MTPEDLIVWPNGAWCFRNELEEMTHLSDDYKVLESNTPEWVEFLSVHESEIGEPAPEEGE